MTWSFPKLSNIDKTNLTFCGMFWIFAFAIAVLPPKIRNMGSGEAWYESKKSALTPPSWVFTVVWISIYAGMAWSLFEVVTWGGEGFLKMKVLNMLNWALAIVWPFLFVYQQFKAAFVVILLMIVTLVLLLYFHLTAPDSEMSFAPVFVYGVYIAWLGFAAILSYSFI